MRKYFLTILILCTSMIALDQAVAAGKKGKSGEDENKPRNSQQPRAVEISEKKPPNSLLPQSKPISSPILSPGPSPIPSPSPDISYPPLSGEKPKSSYSSKLPAPVPKKSDPVVEKPAPVVEKPVLEPENKKESNEEILLDPNDQGVIKLGSYDAKKKWESIQTGKWDKLLLDDKKSKEEKLKEADSHYKTSIIQLEILELNLIETYMAKNLLKMIKNKDEKQQKENSIYASILETMKERKTELTRKFDLFKQHLDKGDYAPIGRYSGGFEVDDVSEYVKKKENKWELFEKFLRIKAEAAKDNEDELHNLTFFKNYLVGSFVLNGKKIQTTPAINSDEVIKAIRDIVDERLESFYEKYDPLYWATNRRIKWNNRLTQNNLDEDIQVLYNKMNLKN